MTKVNDVAITIAAKDKARYTRARNAFSRSSGTFRNVIADIARTYFDGPLTVAQFAKVMGEDLSMGKGVTEEVKRIRATIRARIHDGLKHADMLKVNQRMAQAQGKRRKAEAASTEAADKAQEAQEAIAQAKEAKAPTQRELFEAIAGMLEHASPATLRRIANAVSVKLASAA